jgi:hypothetical protein
MDRRAVWGEGVFAFVDELLEGDLHGKRVLSLANATLGVMVSASLAVAVIGRSLAQARGLLTKHAVKQVDRLLSNQAVDPWAIAARWVPEVIGSSTDIMVVMDWTDFDADGQTTLALTMDTPHGGATPLLWLTVMKDDLKNKRNAYEDACLKRLAEVLPAGVKVTILADRGFGDTKLFSYLGTLGFDYVIRFRGNTHVTATTGERRPAADWVGKGGRAVKLSGAALTASEHPVGAVVCVKAKDMKEPWCLAASFANATTREIIDAYAKRWTIEPGFRDTKDIRFGMGLSLLRISRPDRRDRLLLLNAFAIHLLTMLGTAGEELGMDRHLKSNTSKTRTHSLFRQGCMLYDLIPNMPEVRLRPLMLHFAEVMQRSSAIQNLVAVS